MISDVFNCNSFYFYIKPQLTGYGLVSCGIVIHSISTSNHNLGVYLALRERIVIHSISTSNHNGHVLV